jgi:RimJ/RimL family protein N-acetyltransferase
MHPFVTAAVGTVRRRRRIVEPIHGCTVPVPPAPGPRSSPVTAGSAIELRCLTPGDAHHVARLLERLSPDSRYQRYFRPMHSLAPTDLARFVAVSPDHLAVGAFDSDGLVGVAQYFRSAVNHGVAEVAVEVADSHHRRRVGARLVSALARLAVDGGITHFTATVLADNQQVLGLMRHSGWEIAMTLDGPYADVVVTLPDPCRGGPGSTPSGTAGGPGRGSPRATGQENRSGLASHRCLQCRMPSTGTA